MSIKLSPRDFFLYVAAIVTLYVSAISILTLLFEYINYLYPEPLEYVDPYSGTMRFAIASLIVVFPLYLFFTRYVNRDLRKNPEKRDAGIRKWLLYITVFVAGATLAGDLIALINTFLGGELTTRFVLKVIAVFVIIGGAFLYYFLDLRGYWERREPLSKAVGGVVALLTLTSIVAGFFIMGSPADQRQLRFDEQKVSDLQSIQWELVNYWQQKEALPASLAGLEDPIRGYQVPTDPETQSEYEYRVVGPLSFELCAEFNRPTPENRYDESFAPRGVGVMNENWDHEAGRTCFTRTIDPQLFPPTTKI